MKKLLLISLISINYIFAAVPEVFQTGEIIDPVRFQTNQSYLENLATERGLPFTLPSIDYGSVFTSEKLENLALTVKSLNPIYDIPLPQLSGQAITASLINQVYQNIENFIFQATKTSCLEIKNINNSASDGEYLIDPDGYNTGDAPFNAYCDMQNGGWTLVAKMQQGSNTWNYSSSLWTTSGNEFNTDSGNYLATNEAKYKTFDTVSGTEIKITTSRIQESIIASGINNTLLHTFNNETSLALSTSGSDNIFSYIGPNPHDICAGIRNNLVANYGLYINYSGIYTNTSGSTLANGNVRLGYWTSGSNSHIPAETASCASGLGLYANRIYDGAVTDSSANTAGGIDYLWVR